MNTYEVKSMERKIVQVYYGPGKGKTMAAVGQCIRAASLGQKVIMIQFLKGRDSEEFSFLKKLEPEIKLFRFEKAQGFYQDLKKSEQEEEKKNIINGFHFARKVLETGECDVLVLDEILGLVDFQILQLEDVVKLIQLKDDYKRLVLTGKNLPERFSEYVDVISKIELMKDQEGK